MKIFIQENVFENVVCIRLAILFHFPCVECRIILDEQTMYFAIQIITNIFHFSQLFIAVRFYAVFKGLRPEGACETGSQIPRA